MTVDSEFGTNGLAGFLNSKPDYTWDDIALINQGCREIVVKSP